MEQTPKCGSLVHNQPLQTSPTPDVKDKHPIPLFKMPAGHNLAGLSVKQHSWIASTQNIDKTDLALDY